MSAVRVPSLLCTAQVHHQRGEASRRCCWSASAVTFRQNFRPIRLGGQCVIALCVASDAAAALPVDNEVLKSGDGASNVEQDQGTHAEAEDDEGKAKIDKAEAELRIKRMRDWAKVQKLMASGRIFEAKVEDFNQGGLIVRFNNLRGFVPFSQFSLARLPRGTKKVTDIAMNYVGKTLPLKVIQCDRKKGKLVLSEIEGLWTKYSSKFKQGAVFDGIVTGLVDYGAFVDICVDGTYPAVGLVHFREISWDVVKHPKDVLTVGQQVRVKLIGFEPKSSKLALSIRRLQPDPLMETLDTLMPKENDPDVKADEEALVTEPLPGIDQICEGLQKETGITAVKLGRQAVEKHVVSQDLELWLSQEPVEDGHITLLARAGRQVQEVHVTTSLGREDMKVAIQRVTQKIP